MNMAAKIDTIVDGAITTAPDYVCYEAHWHDRSVFISAPCQSAREWQWHCLASAILLERLEDACVFAETLLDSSLQFFVSELPAQSKQDELTDEGYLRVIYKSTDDEVEIWLPARAHSQVVQHSDLIDSSNLRWSEVQAKIEIAKISLDADDVSRLMLGSLLLIPESWQAKWTCSLHVQELDQTISATLNPSAQAVELENQSDSNSGLVSERAPDVVLAYLDSTVKINPSQLLGRELEAGKGSKACEALPVALTQSSCSCVINQKAFKADLLPVGDGYGLCITEY